MSWATVLFKYLCRRIKTKDRIMKVSVRKPRDRAQAAYRQLASAILTNDFAAALACLEMLKVYGCSPVLPTTLQHEMAFMAERAKCNGSVGNTIPIAHRETRARLRFELKVKGWKAPYLRLTVSGSAALETALKPITGTRLPVRLH